MSDKHKLYVCILLYEKNTVKVSAVEAVSLKDAVDHAKALCLRHHTGTQYEIWEKGKKVHVGAPRRDAPIAG